ncbi:TldD/PmbA family protein, partial [Clostridium perfringens]|nr:TldD/PmbA family protein [Clostridium perfringens]
VVLNEKTIYNNNPIIYIPSSISAQKKIEVMKIGYKAAKEYHDEIKQVSVGYLDKEQNVLIANTEGLYTEDRRVRTRLSISSVASLNGENQTGFEGPGAHKGFELFNDIDPEYYGKEASRVAYTMLHAKNCPAGKMPVAIDNGFGGVIFHEACGHSLEATAVAKGNSVFTNM